MKKTYCVTYAFEGRYECMVEAESIEQAKELARDEWESANLNESEIIEGRPVTVEDENDIVWEA